MLIQFTHDFRGTLTQERFYPTGTIIEIDPEIGAELIALHHAVPAEAAPASEPEAESVEEMHVIELDESAADVDDGEDTGDLEPGVYDGWTRADLYTAAVERELDVTTRDTKAELLAALLNSDQEAGDDGPA